MANNRDDFPAKTVEILKQRAAFICSKPDCKKMTVAPAESSNDQVLYIGRAAHICAAAKGGPRYDENMTEDQRSDITNAIFLCANCADMIDDNRGADFSANLLRKWKADHEAWVQASLNKTVKTAGQPTVINVQSQNQSGGIIAGVINFEKPVRHINSQLIAQLAKDFPDTKEQIAVNSVAGDSEAYNFAEEIRLHLVGRGFKLAGTGQVQEFPVVKGISIGWSRGHREIMVGYRE